MSRMRTFAVAALAAAASATAQAADVRAPMPPPIQSAPATIEEYASGWYLRGDIGYRMNTTSGATAFLGPVPTDARIEDSYMFGGGFGYKLRWFRTDLTVDYGTITKFHASTPALADDYLARMDSFTILANGYLDLGTWSGFTPYVGGGIGGALLQVQDFQRTLAATSVQVPHGSRWNLAWAAMAGVGYNLSSNFLVDLGYRYISMGDVQSGIDFFGNSLTLDGLASHEFRIGVRYMFD
jgi:opacity protein-like surface antigen